VELLRYSTATAVLCELQEAGNGQFCGQLRERDRR